MLQIIGGKKQMGCYYKSRLQWISTWSCTKLCFILIYVYKSNSINYLITRDSTFKNWKVTLSDRLMLKHHNGKNKVLLFAPGFVVPWLGFFSLVRKLDTISAMQKG